MIVASKETLELLTSAGVKPDRILILSNEEEKKKALCEKEAVLILKEKELKEILEEINELRGKRNFGIIVISDEKSPEMERIADEIIPTSFSSEFLAKSIKRVLREKRKEAEETKLLSESIEYMELLSVYRRGMKIVGIVEQDIYQEILKAFIEETRAESGLIWSKRGESFKAVEIRGEIDPKAFHSYLKEEDLKGGKTIKIEEKLLLSPFVIDEVIEGALILSKKRGFTERDLKIANILSKFSAIALRNWRKISEYMDKTLRTEFKMYTPIFFSEYIDKEINKARRYRREFSLVYISVSNFTSIKKNFSESVINENLERMLKLVAGGIRSADIFSKLSENEYLLLLPETEYIGSWMTRLRIESMLKGKLHITEGKKAFPINLVLSSATYPMDGLTYGALLEVLKVRADFEKSYIYQKILSSERKDIFEKLEEVKDENHLLSEVTISLEDFKKILSLFIEDLLREKGQKSIIFIKTSNPELSKYLEELKASLLQNIRFHQIKGNGDLLFFYMKGPSGYFLAGRVDEKNIIKGIHSDSLLLTESFFKKIIEEEEIDLSG